MINVKKILSQTEKWLLAGYTYANGIDYLNDAEYDVLREGLSDMCPYKYMSYEGTRFDEIEKLAEYEKINLNNIKIESVKQEISQPSATQKMLMMFPPASSMQMVSDYETVYDKYVPQIVELIEMNKTTDGILVELLQTYKMDGWNITCYYQPSGNDFKGEGNAVDGEIFLAHTRGRTTTDVTVCTELMKKLTPNLKEYTDQMPKDTILRITGELVIKKTYNGRDTLEVLREAYPTKPFSNVRNSVSAFAHQSINIDKYYDMASYFVFNIFDYKTGGCPFNKVSDMRKWLEEKGFNIPPGNLIRVPTHTKSGAVINPTVGIIKYLEHYYKAAEKYYTETFQNMYECDGIVLQPNELSWNNQMQQIAQGNFSDGLLAIKANYWAEKIYSAVVEEIIYPPARVSRSVLAIVKPVRTTLGQVVKRVPLINLQRAAIENDVRVGDTIEFMFHSNQLPFFIRNISYIRRQERNKQMT